MSFEDERRELKDLRARVKTSSPHQDRASKKMLLALITIVYRLTLQIEASERR